MGKVTIEIDSKWLKRVNSPLFRVVQTFQGAAVSFAPLFLYESGKGWFRNYEYAVAVSCLAIILLVGFFYIRLGGEIVQELRRKASQP
jgi:hypothetical protein